MLKKKNPVAYFWTPPRESRKDGTESIPVHHLDSAESKRTVEKFSEKGAGVDDGVQTRGKLNWFCGLSCRFQASLTRLRHREAMDSGRKVLPKNTILPPFQGVSGG